MLHFAIRLHAEVGYKMMSINKLIYNLKTVAQLSKYEQPPPPMLGPIDNRNLVLQNSQKTIQNVDKIKYFNFLMHVQLTHLHVMEKSQ